MQQIRQYKCKLVGTKLTVQLPTDAMDLSFVNQAGTIYCYVVTETWVLAERQFLVLKAPADIPAGAKYLTSIQMNGRKHIFQP